MRRVFRIAQSAGTTLRKRDDGGRKKRDVEGRKATPAGFVAAAVSMAVLLALAFVCGCGKTDDQEAPSSKAEKPAGGLPEELVNHMETAPGPGVTVVASAEKPAEVLPADFVNYTESIEGLDGTVVPFEMIAVPGDTFTMGSPDSEKGRKKDEGPQHEVTVGPFWIGKVEVTWDEYEAFAYPYRPKGAPWMEKYVDGVTRPTMPWGDSYRNFGRDGKPVIGMSWYGAMVYCRWLSRRTGKMYRLPTEAEWEYACRAGAEGTYCFGDDASKLGEYAWHTDNAENSTHDVATKKPNAWGIYDMHGNVSEWCLDWYGSTHFGSVPSGKWPKDPQGPESGKNHVIRGGSWKSNADQVRSARRNRSSDWWLKLDPQEPKSHWWLVPTDNIGFRVVRPLHGEEPPFPAMSNGL